MQEDVHIQIKNLYEKQLTTLTSEMNGFEERNFSFSKVLATSSFTIASFSILSLQINPSIATVDNNSLIMGFKILLLNSLLPMICIKINSEVERIFNINPSVKLLNLHEKLVQISRNDQGLTNPETKELVNNIFNLTEQTEINKRRKVIEMTNLTIMIVNYVSLIAMIVGIYFIGKAFVFNYGT